MLDETGSVLASFPVQTFHVWFASFLLSLINHTFEKHIDKQLCDKTNKQLSIIRKQLSEKYCWNKLSNHLKAKQTQLAIFIVTS